MRCSDGIAQGSCSQSFAENRSSSRDKGTHPVSRQRMERRMQYNDIG